MYIFHFTASISTIIDVLEDCSVCNMEEQLYEDRLFIQGEKVGIVQLEASLLEAG